MRKPGIKRHIDGIAVLQDPVRWALYMYVSGRRQDVGRDEAAKAVRISRALAAFHMDKMVEEGLLETSYRRLSAKSGPGAGRPAKLYHRSDKQLTVQLPPRRYDLAAMLLLKAADASDPQAASDALRETAANLGFTLGAQARQRAGANAEREKLIKSAIAELSDYGFEPIREDNGDIVLTNCPFHALVDEHRDMVCGMNLALMEGLVRGLRLSGIEAKLEPKPGLCCVMLCPRRP